MRPVKSGGRGLLYAASNIRENYARESKKYDKITYRLIGDRLSMAYYIQYTVYSRPWAIKLARYSYRLVDDLFSIVSERPKK